MERVNLKELKPHEVTGFMAGMGLPEYRGMQLLHCIYEERVGSIDEITVFSKELRAALNRIAYISGLEFLRRVASTDGTEKFLFRLEDGEGIESVIISDGDRLTLCISSQAGCAMGCGFCRTGMDGLRRNLMAHEIVDQVMAVGKLVFPLRLTNIVLMGMGEPLRNIDEVGDALWRMTSLLKISKRRITLSTSGIVPGIRELPRKAPPVNLAVSLNAATNEARDRIMPVNRTYPLEALLEACRAFPLGKSRKITFEYVLIKGINDSARDARRLVSLLRGIPSKVNLIPLNEFEGCGFNTPSREKVSGFQAVLLKAGLSAFLRKSKGQDILAACGQLTRTLHE